MSYIIVTGAAGFIGSNIVKALNERGERNVIAVDHLKNGDKFANLIDCEIADYIDKEDFLARIESGAFAGKVKAISHQGACSDTTERDGRYMMQNNYEYTKRLLVFCTATHVPFIYASSAAVYGAHTTFKEAPAFEAPLNVYGYSKLLFDQYLRRHSKELTSQVVGLRYFNVYGEREQHKGRMASVAMHFFNQYRANGKVKLFEGNAGYGNGEQQRDFVSVEDIVKINLYFLDHPEKSGIFNAGTGKAQTFNDVAVATINTLRKAEGKPALSLAEIQQQGLIEYIPFPGDLRGRYQSYTQADVSNLRNAGYGEVFLTVEQGVERYIEKLIAKSL